MIEKYMTDRRRGERVAINAEFASIQELLSEYTSDISLAGCFIRSQSPLPKGTMVQLKFTVLDKNLAVIEGQGEVIRVTPEGMGVRFTQLTEESQAHIAGLLSD